MSFSFMALNLNGMSRLFSGESRCCHLWLVVGRWEHVVRRQ